MLPFGNFARLDELTNGDYTVDYAHYNTCRCSRITQQLCIILPQDKNTYRYVFSIKIELISCLRVLIIPTNTNLR